MTHSIDISRARIAGSAERSTSYKRAGVEWLAEIPSHWRVLKIKFIVRPEKDAFTDGDWIESPYITTSGIRLLQCGNIGTGRFEEQGFRYISEDTFRSLRCSEVQPNDILICRMRSSPAILAGRACLAPQLGCRMVTSVDNCILRPTEDHDVRYLVYQMSLSSYLGYVEDTARGGTRDRISRSMLADFKLAIPPRHEQQQISDFLDRKTAKIDTLIAKKQRLIELLQEKCTALIGHAVTRGLNPGVPMKDSGIAWICRVPAHWQLKALGHAIRYISYGFTNPMPVEDDGPYLLTANDVGDGFIKYESARKTSEHAFATELTEKSRPKNKDILLTKDGTLGRIAVFDGARACINQSVALLRVNEEVASVRYYPGKKVFRILSTY